MPSTQVRDIDVHYELHGVSDAGSTPVLLISGTGAALDQNPARDRHPLTRTHEVLMYDQRGLGRSGKPDRPYTMADYADDAAALLDAVGFDRAHVVGISFGGMVAQHLAIRHPDRVARLVLACTSSGGAGGSSFDLLAIDDLAPHAKAAAMLRVLDTRNDPTTDPPTLAPMFDAILPGLGGRPADPDAAIGARRQLEARAGHDAWDALPRVAAPTLVVGGRFDAQAPPENLERLAARIPAARLEFFDGGHLFLLQDRAAWPAVIDFLDARP